MRISCLCVILCEEDNGGVDARKEPVTKVSRRLLVRPGCYDHDHDYHGDDDGDDDHDGDDDDDDDGCDDDARAQGPVASGRPPCSTNMGCHKNILPRMKQIQCRL